MIRASGLVAHARSPSVALGPVDLALSAGSSYSLVGGVLDGVPLLLRVLAGVSRSRAGQITVGGRMPGQRPVVAYVPVASDLPPVLRVDEFLNLAANVRGEPPLVTPEERLGKLGLEVLARRYIGSLTVSEAHAVALVEAVTSRAETLLLEEPLTELDPRAFSRLADALAAQARTGAIVVVSTASREDARELTREQLHFDGGKLVRHCKDDDAFPAVTSCEARLVVGSDGARALLTALATESIFTELEADGAIMKLTGTDPVAMAAAVTRAARVGRIEIHLLQFERARGEP